MSRRMGELKLQASPQKKVAINSKGLLSTTPLVTAVVLGSLFLLPKTGDMSWPAGMPLGIECSFTIHHMHVINATGLYICGLSILLEWCALSYASRVGKR